MTTDSWVARLAGARYDLGRSSTAERVAEVLRDHVTDGTLPPGTRLSEEVLGSTLGVSRNTLREAFRLLSHERLLVHVFNRGVFVRVLSAEDVVDLYRLRRILECAAVREVGTASDAAVTAVRTAVEAGERAAADGHWFDVGTANMRFHQALGALPGSPRVAEIMRQLLAELRLVFHVMSAPREFHEPYLVLNRTILELLERRDGEAAERELHGYFDIAAHQLVQAYTVRTDMNT